MLVKWSKALVALPAPSAYLSDRQVTLSEGLVEVSEASVAFSEPFVAFSEASVGVSEPFVALSEPSVEVSEGLLLGLKARERLLKVAARLLKGRGKQLPALFS